MTPFTTAREAKEFLIAQIVDEAAREDKPLSDVERKMLYFTETAWMPEDTWQANEIFDRDYDPDEYEQHVGQLTTSLKQRPDHDANRWSAAVRLLSEEDHYLLILINPSNFGTSPPEDLTRWKVKFALKAIGVGLLVVLAMFLVRAYFEVFPQ